MPDALSQVSTRVTRQTEKADERQVKNTAGGYVFAAGELTRLHRFLTLGTEGGTYYASERKITKKNAGLILAMARADNPALIAETVAVSQAGRAPRNNPALFALAAAAGLGSERYRAEALAALPLVARTGSHLLTFASYAEQFRGWGPALTKAVGRWYTSRSAQDAAYQIFKYGQRDGWSQRDVLRLSHMGRQELPGPHKVLFAHVIHGRTMRGLSDVVPLVSAVAQAHATRNVRDWVRLIEANRSLSWEMLPSEALAKPEVWSALLNTGLPLGALLRNLGRMTRLGVIKPMAADTKTAVKRLTDPAQLAAARIHPVNLLVALRTYASGHGARGSGEWTPVAKVTDALDAAFYASFGHVEPAGKRTMLGIDVSGSMASPVSGLPLQCREAAGAMALVTAATEPEHMIMGFTGRFIELGISPRQRLDDVISAVYRADFGSTDCALPMLYATEHNLQIDHFGVFTDNETWAGSMHPHQALQRYRERSGIDARLSVTAFTATEFTIADPDDPGTLDVAGFDSAAPKLLADFARGDI